MKMFQCFMLALFLPVSAFAQYQKERVDAPSGTQGQPIQIERDVKGRVISVFSERMLVTVGYTCQGEDVQLRQRHSAVNGGTATGAVVGGAIGYALGGKIPGTAVGAVVGGIVGNEAYKKINNPSDPHAQRLPSNTGECYEVKDYVNVYVYTVLIDGLHYAGQREPVPVEITNVRSFTKYAIGAQVPAKIQINHFVGRLD